MLENQREEFLRKNFRQGWECEPPRPPDREHYRTAVLLKAHPSGYRLPGAAMEAKKTAECPGPTQDVVASE
jgi:hypothetical protein